MKYLFVAASVLVILYILVFHPLWIIPMSVLAAVVYLGLCAARHCKAETGSYRAFFQGGAYAFGWGAIVGLLIFLFIHVPKWLS